MVYRSFFMEDVPRLLQYIRKDSIPQWGVMNASQMLDHLRRGIELSISDIKVKVLTAPEKLPAYRAFLMSDKPFQKNAPKPGEFEDVPSCDGNFEMLKVNLLRSLVKMQVFFEKNPTYTSYHTYFGELRVEEWLHLHKKHILHHFEQFDILKSE